MKNSLKKVFIYTLAIGFLACSEEPIEDISFGSLTGKVVAEGDNTPLSNVKITTLPVSTTVFTDLEGNYEINEIQVGEYSVQAELEEFQAAFEGANILAGKTSNIVFELDSVNAANLLPLSPVLKFPKDGEVDLLTEIEFAWSSSKNDDDDIIYTLELRNGETNEITYHEQIKDTTFLVQGLPIGENFFWQVTADDEINTPAKSALSSFATKGGTANRFFYVRNIDGNNVIFSGSEPDDEDNEPDQINENELQLTSADKNSYRPSKNNRVNKIAFLQSLGGETHLFTMNVNGDEIKQVTSNVPVAGFRQEELEYAWYDSGSKFFYPNFNKLYSINQDGSGNQLVYQVPETSLISEIAVNPTTGLVAIKTNDAQGYNARISVVNVGNNTEQEVVIEGQNGALGGLDFSIDGNRVLFTRDVSGIENSDYRQLDSRIFEYDLSTDMTIEINTGKAEGTNDLDAKYSPDDGAIIFMNTSNDGISEKGVYKTIVDGVFGQSEDLFTNAFMPNWE